MNKMPGMELIAIAAGGSCGAIFRYLISQGLSSITSSPFPWGTLAANLTGCLLIGLMIGGEHDQKNEIVRLGFGIGFLGSLTTFSTFGAETLKHAMEGSWGIVVGNVFLNVVVCLAMVASGIYLGKKLWA